MQRVTITIDQDLLNRLDQFMDEKNYANRSEAIRDMVRDKLESEILEIKQEGSTCVATLSYLYDHEERELAKRLAQLHHSHHKISNTILQVPIDENTCLEAAILKGDIQSVENLANTIIAERGVRHGALHIIPAKLPVFSGDAHTHPDDNSDSVNPNHTHDHTHEHKHVHTHDHKHEHEHWHTHKDGTYHSHSHEHIHNHPHEHIHNHGHSHTHSHDHESPHQHHHKGDHTHDFRAHDHDHVGEDHGRHSHDHPGHEAELHDDHRH